MSKPELARTKTDIIRQYLTNFPDIKPPQLAEKINAEFPQFKVNKQEIYNIRSQERKKQQQPEEPETKKREPDFVEGLKCLKVARDVFGVAKAKEILDLL